MPDEKLIKTILEAQNALEKQRSAEAIEVATRATQPLVDALRNIERNPGIRQMLESIKHQEVLTRTAFAPLEELGRAGIFDVDSSWRRELELARNAMDGFHARFRLPEMTETARLIKECRANSIAGTLARYAEQETTLQRAMESMRTPWLVVQEAMRSMASFAELQGTGSDLKVFIITCKHHDTFKQQVLDNLIASLSELFDFGIEEQNLKGSYSESVLRMRSNLRYAYRKLSPRLASFSVSTFYASRGDTSEIGAEVVSRAAQLEALIRECFGSCSSDFTFVGSTELVALHRKMRNYTLELPFVEALAKGERYVVLVRLSDYFEFISDEGKLRRYLFESNVRDFVGMNRVNEDIRATLENSSSPDFWWLNNGVTILATSASITGKSIQAAEIQIVNGLQTTESIFRYFEHKTDVRDERCVLVKVIVSKDEAVRDSIIRATNNQTDVELASLHATDKIQRDIEDVLLRHGLFYDRRKNYYSNLGHAPAEIVTPLYVAAGYIALVLKLPHKACVLRSKFMRSPESYNAVFAATAPIEVWASIAKLLKRIDVELENLRPQGKGTDRFLKGWRYIVAFLMVAEATGKYSFSAAELATFDVSRITSGAVKVIWSELNGYLSSARMFYGWTSHANIIDACRRFGDPRGISGTEMLEKRSGINPGSLAQRRDVALLITPEFLNKVKEALPPQPWKPGIHKSVSAELGCDTTTYFAAVDKLIDDGLLYRQKDGVLYDPDGNVVKFDPDRVDPETLQLLSART